MEELRALAEQVRKTAPFNEHARAVANLAVHLVGVLEAQNRQLAALTDQVASLTPPDVP